MYHGSDAYKTAIKQLVRTFDLKIGVKIGDQSLNITSKNIVLNSFNVSESCMKCDCIGIGAFNASTMHVIIDNSDGSYNGIDFSSAVLSPEVGLKLPSGEFEYIPMGVFSVDPGGKATVNTLDNTIEINAADNAFKFDVPWKVVQIEFPCTIYNILYQTCRYVGIQLKTTTFTNSTLIVKQRPTADMSCRDVISWIAQAAGNFARIDRAGALEFAWMNSTPDISINPSQREKMTKTAKETSGIQVVYFLGDYFYASLGGFEIDVSKNPFLIPVDEFNIEPLIEPIHVACGNFTFFPCSCDWQGDPALQAGDVIQHSTKDGSTFVTYAAKTTYKYRQTCTVEANQNVSAKTAATSTDVKNGESGSTVAVYTCENSAAIALGSTSVDIIDIVFAAVKQANPLFTASINFTITTAGTIKFTYYIDAVEYYVTPKQTVPIGNCIVTLHLPLTNVSGNSQHEIKVTMQSDDAVGTIATRQVQASLFGQGLAVTKAWNGRIEVKDKFAAVNIASKVTIADFTAALTAPTLNTSTVINMSQAIPAVTVSTGTITVANIASNILTEKVVTGEKFTMNLANSGNYTYPSYYIDTVADAFKPRESYIFVGAETTIDSGKMLEIDIDTAQFKSVSAITVGV